MISIPVWQLVLSVLFGVALGAIVTILAFARGRQGAGRSASAFSAPTSPASDKIVASPSATATLVAAATRQERVKTFLKNRVANQKNVTIDETAKALDVSSRRVRRLLDDGALVAIPMAGGGRLVSAVSVLDLIIRREAAQIEKPPKVEVHEEPVGGLAEPLAVAVGAADGLPKVGPRQLYWYYVAGQDKPLSSIREALRVLGLNFAYTGWGEIPVAIKAKIRRERVA